MNALIYANSGGGKTVNSTLVKGKKNLLICSDNSSIVLRQFKRENLDIVTVNTAEEFVDAYQKGYGAGKYENIICDNISDLFDMWILEMDESGKFKDMRQAYQIVYQSLKRLSRESAAANCNTIFTAWADYVEVVQPDGTKIQRLQPKLPLKILDNVCGLMNIVGYINTAMKDGKKRWYYSLEGSPNMVAKDQLGCRKSCMPEDLWEVK